MRSNFEQAYRWILQHEGGYVNHPEDPGGATNKGVTQRTYDAYRTGLGMPRQDVRDIGNPEVRAIYENQYAIPIRFDSLPAGLDYAMFDFAVNSGPARAAQFLQRLVGVRADGIIGAQTLAKVQAADAQNLIARLCDARLKYMRSLKTWKTFGRGWQRRMEQVRAQALAMASGNPVLPADAVPAVTGNSKADGAQSLIGSIAASKRSKGAAVGLVSTAFAALPEAMEAARPAQEFVDFARYAGWIGLLIVAAALVYIIWERSRATD
ncbi:glycoside hydrolase family 108 protein [Cardiobacterium hominis]|mgnify:CR=1 FL=1|uniref:glycoside hydrolase family 108 protein n=1 Tax=Cardiobacterium hominis TaxID=2718 RepID=UPI00066110CE|nr:glycoside hydrolase family 108 protein [Cardiobacterium hominis]